MVDVGEVCFYIAAVVGALAGRMSALVQSTVDRAVLAVHREVAVVV